MTETTDWNALSAAASMASHRLLGWMFFDKAAVAGYEKLGVPNGIGFYVAARAAPLAAAGNSAVVAAFYSITPIGVQMSLDLCREHTSFEAAAAVRDEFALAGLTEECPEILDSLGTMAPELWAAAASLTMSGRVFASAHFDWPRPDHPVVSAWHALTVIREWRGDTHWAILVSNDLNGTEAGLLHDAYLNYPPEWITRSRGASDEEVELAWARLAAKGLASGTTVNDAGLALRQEIEDRTDAISSAAWRSLGAERTQAFIDLVEPVAPRLMARVDRDAGENWMPAARDRRS